MMETKSLDVIQLYGVSREDARPDRPQQSFKLMAASLLLVPYDMIILFQASACHAGRKNAWMGLALPPMIVAVSLCLEDYTALLLARISRF